MTKLIAGLFVCAALAACSSSPAPTAATSAAPAPATTNALAGTPMAAYGHDLNRAKNVQNVIDAQAGRQAAVIDPASVSSSGN